jgi:hypothetical protein
MIPYFPVSTPEPLEGEPRDVDPGIHKTPYHKETLLPRRQRLCANDLPFLTPM